MLDEKGVIERYKHIRQYLIMDSGLDVILVE